MKEKRIKVGSLVEVGPSFIGLYIVVHEGSSDPLLEDCPMLYSVEEGYMAPMNKKWIKVLSE